MKVGVYEQLPKGFFDVAVEELYTIVPEPSIFYLRGKQQQPLFISTLLHGDETTGFYALQQLLKKYAGGDNLPRSLLIFIGNTVAAQHGVRFLAEQHDYNRVWRHGDSLEHKMAQQVLEIAKQHKPFACIDIHNNSGRNPHHACINKLNPCSIYLASLFHNKIIYFTRPDEVLSNAFARFCPSLVIECGISGGKDIVPLVVDYLDMSLQLTDLNKKPKQAINIYHSLGNIKLAKEKEISFAKNDSAAFCFVDNLDEFNFKELPPHTLLGWRKSIDDVLSVTDEHGQEISDSYIEYIDNEIRTKKKIIPSMFTKNIANIRLDCLGYIMKEIKIS